MSGRGRIARRRLVVLGAIGLASALMWGTVGSFSSASGQTPSPPTGLIERAHKGARKPTLDRPIFLLLIGGDAREGNPPRARADSIHIVGIDPQRDKAAILGIPRDSFVEIPGYGRNKINAASTFGGPELMIRTVEGISGCRFDYYMMVSFDGFRGPRGSYRTKGIVNELGGVHVRVRERLTERLPYPVARGYNLLNGGEALSFTRNRHERPRGDFDRSLAQGEFLVWTLREMRADFKANAGTALRNLAVARKHLRMNIGLTEALELGLMTLDISHRDVQNRVVAGRIGSDPRAGSIVRITSRGRAQLIDICGDGLLD